MDSKKWTKLRDKCPSRRSDEWVNLGETVIRSMCLARSNDDFEEPVCRLSKHCPFVYWHESLTTME